ncbi:MAG: GTPase Era [Planctomycetes bacterium]|nr:GTPase Era [Planctomycetota bacterium]
MPATVGSPADTSVPPAAAGDAAAAGGHPYRSGFIGILGRPNVGKSTFLNRVIGEKVAIVTPKPQTTRDKIMGILHFEGGQMVFLDTPGVHRGTTTLNRHMVQVALRTLDDADLLFCLFEPPAASLGYPRGDQGLFLDDESLLLLEHLSRTRTPKFLVINKVDVLDEGPVIAHFTGRQALQPLVEAVRQHAAFDESFVISARTGEGIDALVEAAKSRMPEGPPYFPEGMFTDQTDRSFAAEVIREKIFLLLGQEIPYHSAVTIEEFDDSEETLHLHATIHVDRESQKGIVIGHRGQMIRNLRIAAREEIQKILGQPVFLKLQVRVSERWSQDDRIMKRLGYHL